MNIPADTINSAMNLAGGALALLAAIVAAVTTILPKEKTAAAIANLRTKAFGAVVFSSAIASGVSLVLFDSPRAAFFFVFVCMSLTSVQFLRSEGPATRWQIFMLVMQVAIFLAFALLYYSTIVLSILERLA